MVCIDRHNIDGLSIQIELMTTFFLYMRDIFLGSRSLFSCGHSQFKIVAFLCVCVCTQKYRDVYIYIYVYKHLQEMNSQKSIPIFLNR